MEKTLLDVAENGPTHQDELTEFVEAENEVHQDMPLSVSDLHRTISNPYPTQTPINILSRNYRVATIPWGPGFTTQTLDFPKLLTDQLTIKDALSSFQYFRADVKLEFRINSTPFHVGALMISWLPYYRGSTPTVFSASGNHPVVISASVQQAATITIPYVNPLSFVRWRSTFANSIARVFIHELVPITATTDTLPDTIPIQVFASFHNPEVAGYIPNDTTLPNVQAQTTKSRLATPKDKEAESKSKFAIVTTASKISNAVTPILSDLGPFGAGLAGIANAIFPPNGKLFGIFDKPTSVGTSQSFKFDFGRDFAHGSGLDETHSLSLYPSPKLAQATDIMGGEQSFMPVATIAAVPMLHSIFQFSDLATQTSFVVDPYFLSNSAFQPDYLMYTAAPFQFWRGSIKYLFHFVTSAFTTGRFRISVNYVPWTSDVTVTGDVISRIVDVKGDTMAELNVPYLWDTHWRQVGVSYGGFPRLVVEAITDIIGQSLDTDPNVTLLTWRSGGEDIEFQQLGPAQFLNPSEELPNVQAQTSIRARFTQPFESVVAGATLAQEKGFTATEVVNLLSDCLKRYSTQNVFNSLPAPTALNKLEPYFYFSQMFYHWRGSRRVKQYVQNTSDAFIAIAGMQTTAGGSNSSVGITTTHPGQMPLLEYEVPWFSTVPWFPVSPSASALDDITTTLPRDFVNNTSINVPFTTMAFYVSAGDDFSFGFLRAPPDYPLTPLAEPSPRTRRRTAAPKLSRTQEGSKAVKDQKVPKETVSS